MKRILLLSFLLISFLVCVSCEMEPSHEHTFSHEWTYDNEYHWHEPTCGHDVVSGKAAHSWNSGVVAVAPTHTETGVKTYTCTVCGKTKTEAVPALVEAHTFSTEWTSDVTYHWHAATCVHTTLKSQQSEHTWGAGVITSSATCTEDGVITFTCSVCGRTKTETVAALGHDYSDEWTIDVSATCTGNGSKSHHCSRCDSKTDITAIEQTGHSYGSVVTCEPSCASAGERQFTCSVCNDSYTEPIEALGHDYSDEWTIDVSATCTGNGSKSHHCSRCDSKSEETVIPAIGHSWDNPTFSWSKDYKCTASRVCTHDSTHIETETIQGVYSEVTAATCTSIGSGKYTAQFTNTAFVQQEKNVELSMIAHTFDKEVVDVKYLKSFATCTTKAVYYKSCGCGAIGTETFEYGDTLPHEYNQEVVSSEFLKSVANCTSPAIYYKSCICGKKSENDTFEKGEALGHSLVHHDAKNPTCTENGWYEYDTCSRCNYSSYNEIPMLGHSIVHHDAKDPSCTSIGWTIYDTCSVCDYSTYNELPLLEHPFKDNVCEACGHNRLLGDMVVGTHTFEKTGEVLVIDDEVDVECGGKNNITNAAYGSFEQKSGTITISPYYIGKYEVTRDLFSYVMNWRGEYLPYSFNNSLLPASATWYESIAFCNKLSLICGLDPCYSVEGIQDWATLSKDDIPAENNTNWNNAICDTAKNGYRLPSEEEWEFAARGADPSSEVWMYLFSGSEILSDVAWFGGQLKGFGEVGQKAPNTLGIYDMTGNYIEWCQNCVGTIYTDTYPKQAILMRAIRGGYYGYTQLTDLCVSKRGNHKPFSSSFNNPFGDMIGFRLVRTALDE